MQKINSFFSGSDKRFMRLALSESMRGAGRVHPNPKVGAVLVLGGKVIGRGAHEYFGGPHAEVNALARFKKIPRKAILYVTLEPCDHSGKTPPCTDLLIKKGLRRLVVAMKDPNPRVLGRGIQKLQKNHVDVRWGLFEDQAALINRAYVKWMQKKQPFVTLKIAQSLDGKIATSSGQSQWISGVISRNQTQKLRAEHDAIIVGVNTLLKDNPLLSLRPKSKQAVCQPVKVVLDASLKTRDHARIFSKESPGKVMIFTSKRSSAARRKALQGKAEILVVKENKKGKLDWKEILSRLADRGIISVMIEGGGEVASSALFAGVVDEVYFFVAPILIGGKEAVSSVGGEGASDLGKALKFKKWNISKSGADLLFHGMF